MEYAGCNLEEPMTTGKQQFTPVTAGLNATTEMGVLHAIRQEFLPTGLTNRLC
nr:hypothetical protein [Caldanaerobacter subterraneus]